MIEKHCIYCGAEIIPAEGNTTTQRYCGSECARKAANAQKVERRRAIKAAEAVKKCAPKAVMGLDACMKEAARRGVSYGKYMAGRADNG